MASRKLRRAPMETEPRPASLETERRTAIALAFENAPVGVALLAWHSGFSMLAVNRTMCEMVGYSEEELLAGGADLVSHPDDRAAEAERADRLLDGELDRYTIDKRYVRKDGTVFRSSLHVVAARDPDGGLIDVIAFVENVEASRRGEERFRAAMSASFDAFMLFEPVRDAGGDIVDFLVEYANDSIVAAVGLTPVAIIGRPLSKVVFDEVRDELFGALRSVVHAQEPSEGELSLEFNGDPLWVRYQIVPVGNGAAFSARDVTRSRHAVDTLRQSEERFRALVQNSSDLISVYDEALEVVYLSPSHETVLGYKPAELTKKEIACLAHEDDVDRVASAIRLVAVEPGRTATCQYRFRHADGSWRQLEAKVSNLLHEPAVRGVVVNARDITEASEALDALREREEWFRSLVQHSWDLVSVIGADGQWTYISPSHTLALGRPIDEIIRNTAELVHPDDREAVREAFAAIRAEPGAHGKIHYRLLHADGTWRFFEVTHTNLLHDPTVRGIVINSRDVTEATAALNALRGSEERFATLVRYSSDVVLVTQRDGIVHYVSPAVAYVLGYAEEDFGERSLASYVHPDDCSAWEGHLAEVLEFPSREHTLELRLRHADGRWRWMEVHAVNLLDDKALRGVVVHLHDISERRVAESELEHQALHDPLTGLPNRALVLDRLGRALARGSRAGTRTIVLFIDVDRFKVVNDSLGHAYGDDLLVAVAARLRASLRESDTVARLGGDEFVVLLEDLAHEKIALDVADKILEAMRRPFALAGREFFVTASIGFAMSTSPNDTPESMIRDADAAMYVAKGRGRNRLEVFDETIRVRVVRHLEMESDLHRALERGELRLVYQPAYELETDRIVGVEALVRWDHP
ncbi:MAG: hypothetical protein QOI55_1980, partial [Actinomycetota bacterium]|nr:hypothetical protein [Actinomycetota bacterium]